MEYHGGEACEHSGVKHPGFTGHNPDMRWIPPNRDHSYTFTILLGILGVLLQGAIHTPLLFYKVYYN